MGGESGHADASGTAMLSLSRQILKMPPLQAAM